MLFTGAESGKATFAAIIMSVGFLGTHMMMRKKNMDQQGVNVSRKMIKHKLKAANIAALTQIKAELTAIPLDRKKEVVPKNFIVKIPEISELSKDEVYQAMTESKTVPYNRKVQMALLSSEDQIQDGIIILEADSKFEKIQEKTKARFEVKFNGGRPGEERTEEFNLTPPNPNRPVDYMFVFDNSASMRSIIANIGKKMSRVLKDDNFPKNSRMAVMTTLIARNATRYINEINPKLNKSEQLTFDPGFMRVVSQQSVDRFIKLTGGRVPRFYKDKFCDSWFFPTEKKNGQFCLLMAMRSRFLGMGVEAGMKAFSQFIRSRKEPFFRNNAVVNVIFLSDTHEPGKNIRSWEFIEYRRVLNQVLNNNPKIAALRFHGIVPVRKKCTGENLHDQSYQKWINPSGGSIHHVCQRGYDTFFRDLALNSASASSTRIQLQYRPRKVLEVLVNGQAKTDIPRLDEGLGWEITDLLPTYDPQLNYDIKVTYISSGKKGYETLENDE